MKAALALLPLLAFGAAPALADSFTYDFTQPNSTAGLTLTAGTDSANEQGAHLTGTGLALTPNALAQSGAAYTNAVLALGASPSFTTSFQFSIATSPTVQSGNGFAFVLASSGNGLGASDQNLGLNQSVNSLAVEFSDFGNKVQNPSIGNGLYNSNLVAAIQNGNTVVAGNPTGSYGSPGPTECDLKSGRGAGCMNNGDVWTVNISYAGGLLNVSLADGAGAFMNVITNYAIALGSNVVAGFSASTNTAEDSVTLLNWQFSSNVPEPATFGLLGLGMAALGLARRRAAV